VNVQVASRAVDEALINTVIAAVRGHALLVCIRDGLYGMICVSLILLLSTDALNRLFIVDPVNPMHLRGEGRICNLWIDQP
jgi:hypothetical protein